MDPTEGLSVDLGPNRRPTAGYDVPFSGFFLKVEFLGISQSPLCVLVGCLGYFWFGFEALDLGACFCFSFFFFFSFF
jgi:hypothetical protein